MVADLETEIVDPNDMDTVFREIQHLHKDINQVMFAVVLFGLLILTNLPRCKFKKKENSDE
jgi:hypothetical protein